MTNYVTFRIGNREAAISIQDARKLGDLLWTLGQREQIRQERIKKPDEGVKETAIQIKGLGQAFLNAIPDMTD